MNESRVSIDSSKSLSAFDELQQECKKLVGYEGELVDTFGTAFANDNLPFYKKMEKIAQGVQNVFVDAQATAKKLAEQTLEHADRMKKFGEEY